MRHGTESFCDPLQMDTLLATNGTLLSKSGLRSHSERRLRAPIVSHIDYDPTPRSFDQYTWDDVAEFLPRIPPFEADLLALHFRSKIPQHAIAALFGKRQSSISYRIARGVQRIQFLLQLPRISRARLAEAVMAVSPRDVRLCLDVVETTSQTRAHARRRCSINGMMLRYDRVIRLLRDAVLSDPGIEPALRTLVLVRENPRILEKHRSRRWRRAR